MAFGDEQGLNQSPPRGATGRFGRLLAAALLSWALATATRAGEESLEPAVKATYLYKLAPFVDWPRGAFRTESLVICVIGDDPFGAVLDRAVAGQAFRGRPILIRRFAIARGGEDCQIMFIGGSQTQTVAQALQAVHGEPVLTVTDGQRNRGVVDFARVDGRVRFRIDAQTAAQDHLGISSKLLSLAVAVNGSRPGAP